MPCLAEGAADKNGFSFEAIVNHMLRPCTYSIIFLLIGLSWSSSALADMRVDAGRGPVTVNVPPSYDPDRPLPLLFFLHGYTSSGQRAENYVRLRALADELEFIYVHPDGRENWWGSRFWDATDACCKFIDSNGDDVEYLSALSDSIRSALSVDASRIYFFGHSNGGFMAYRMACEKSAWVSAVASLAGAAWADAAQCAPANPVAVLQIHGTEDQVIRFAGGTILFRRYPSANETVAGWARMNRCRSTPTLRDSLDLLSSRAGSETVVSAYADCEPGGDTELWTMRGAGHSPELGRSFSRQVVEWLLRHAKAEEPGLEARGE